MPSYNKVILKGHLTRDPELNHTPKGTAVAKFGLALNRVWRTETGEKKEDVTYVDASAFGSTAENLAKYCSKGKEIFLDGHLKLDTWEDKQSGQQRSKLSVVAEIIQYLGAAKPSGSSDELQDQPSKPSGKTAKPKPRSEVEDDSDDVPF